MTFSTRAFVLRQEDWNGHDARLTLYTEVRGKVEAVARGLRKAESKLAAHLEPFTDTEIFLVEGRRYPIVAGSSVTHRHHKLSASLLHLCAAGLLVRLTDLMTPQDSRDDQIFSLLHESLAVIEERDTLNIDEAKFLPHIFAWKLLTHTGYHPELRQCLACKRAIQGETIVINPRRGGVIHGACMATRDASLQISWTALKGLAYMVRAPFHHGVRLRARHGVLDEMSKAIRAFIEERFEVGAASVFWAIE